MPSSRGSDPATDPFIPVVSTTEGFVFSYPKGPPKPPKRRVASGETRRRSRRPRVTAGLLTVALLVLFAGLWASPEVHRWGRGPTTEEVALQKERARGDDLERQNDDMAARLRAPRPPATDDVELARAQDLARQVDELEAKLGIPHPDGGQRSRAEDLKRRLANLEQVLQARRPPPTDGVQRARADDLSRKVQELSVALSRPRPSVDPLAEVRALFTKGDIVAARNLLGLYTTQSPFNYGEVDLIQASVQRKANVVGYFQSWKDPFNDFPIRNAWLRGQVPLMTWESQAQVGSITADQPEFSLPNILRGDFDDVIHDYARGIRSLGLPLVIRFDHEMNGTWYPWSEWADARGESVNGNRKGQYVQVWRHVHDIFQAEGANNYVVWLWAPNRVNRICGQRDPAEFYPGDDYVDWIGMSGYFRNYATAAGPCDDISATFNAVFGATLPKLRAAGSRPIFLAEIGAGEDGGEKVPWINDLFVGLAKNPDIVGFSWFSLSVSSGGENDRVTHDWRINSSAAPMEAMRSGLATSGFGLPTEE